MAAIIITYNPDLTILRESYTSLYKQVDKIILIDNNSTNYQELKKLFEKKEKIKIVPLSDNIGLAAAQNLGLNLAIKNNYTYAILFDQDSVLQDNGINSFFFEFEKLVSEEKLNIVAIGPSFF
ncbi:glycosyltransferase [Escherichia coli]|nr:glycosyltransferase [Escherichia coli]